MTPLEQAYTNLVRRSQTHPWDYDQCSSCDRLKTKSHKRCMICKRNYVEPIEQPNDPSFRIIRLTRGMVALVETEKYAHISAHKWVAVYMTTGKAWYALRYEYPTNGKRITIAMHREVMGLSVDDPRTVDHAFHNTLDNRQFVDGKENLRIASQSEQCWNQRISSKNTSGYKGVSWDKKTQKWVAYITVHGKRQVLGYFDDKEEAYRVRCDAALRLHGKFACLG